MNECDDISAITDGLKSLEAFNELVAARHHAGYCQKRRLNEWVLKGAWLMDRLGSTSHLETWHDTPDPWSADLPEVMRFEDFGKSFTGVEFYLDGTFIGIPPADSICARCHLPWTMDNCHLARHHIVLKEVWIADHQYVGKRYDEIPRATVESDGLRVRIKPATLILKDGNGDIKNAEMGLGYDYVLKSNDRLPFSIVRFQHVEKCF